MPKTQQKSSCESTLLYAPSHLDYMDKVDGTKVLQKTGADMLIYYIEEAEEDFSKPYLKPSYINNENKKNHISSLVSSTKLNIVSLIWSQMLTEINQESDESTLLSTIELDKNKINELNTLLNILGKEKTALKNAVDTKNKLADIKTEITEADSNQRQLDVKRIEVGLELSKLNSTLNTDSIPFAAQKLELEKQKLEIIENIKKQQEFINLLKQQEISLKQIQSFSDSVSELEEKVNQAQNNCYYFYISHTNSAKAFINYIHTTEADTGIAIAQALLWVNHYMQQLVDDSFGPASMTRYRQAIRTCFDNLVENDNISVEEYQQAIEMLAVHFKIRGKGYTLLDDQERFYFVNAFLNLLTRLQQLNLPFKQLGEVLAQESLLSLGNRPSWEIFSALCVCHNQSDDRLFTTPNTNLKDECPIEDVNVRELIFQALNQIEKMHGDNEKLHYPETDSKGRILEWKTIVDPAHDTRKAREILARIFHAHPRVEDKITLAKNIIEQAKNSAKIYIKCKGTPYTFDAKKNPYLDLSPKDKIEFTASEKNTAPVSMFFEKEETAEKEQKEITLKVTPGSKISHDKLIELLKEQGIEVIGQPSGSITLDVKGL